MPKPKSLLGVEYSPGGDEHGILTVKDSGVNLNLGDKLEFIPSHCDTTVNLHDKFYGTRNDQVELVIDIPGRRRK
jgi:D-serine deaminase-like pyridoxal phosphate-dependent protein